MTRSLNVVCSVAAALCVGGLAALSASAATLAAQATSELVQATPDCSSEIVPSTDAAPPCAENQDAAADRAYLVETASPGFTMMLQGPDVAIGRLHPEFVHRLAGAIREARAAGLETAGIFSAYRPPAFGVGGFSDKFNSLHSYGLAVDMAGVGGPGSVEAKTWYEIAARHGVVCPYGVESRTEWNHCQPTWLKIIHTENPLRETITADGPVNLDNMFEAGSAVIDSPPENPSNEAHVGSAAARSEPHDDHKTELARSECGAEPKSGCSTDKHAAAATRSHAVMVAQGLVPHAHCQEEVHPHGGGCVASRAGQTAERRGTRARQAAYKGARESHRA